MEDNRQWNREITKKIINIKEKSWSYTWIHRQNSGYLADIYEWISILSYSLSFFNGIILIFPTNIVYIRVFNILLSFSSGLLIFYIKNKSFPETAEKHKIASSKFSNIYNDIDRQLTLQPESREIATHYHKWISRQFNMLYSSSPDIDPPIIKEYIRKFARRRKINPIEAAEFDKESTNSSVSIVEDGQFQEVVVINDEHPDHKSADSENNNQPDQSDSSSITSNDFGDNVEIQEEDKNLNQDNHQDNKNENNHQDNPEKNDKHHYENRESRREKHHEPRHNSQRRREIDYQLSRMGMGMDFNQEFNNMSTKCAIPEIDFSIVEERKEIISQI